MRHIAVLAFLIIGGIVCFAQDFTETSKFNASDKQITARIGGCLSISDSIATVGSTKSSSFKGGVYVLSKTPLGLWEEKEKIRGLDTEDADRFGSAVSNTSDVVLVGAHREDEDASGANTLSAAGSAYIFEKNMNGDWEQVQKFVSPDREADELFGYEVSIFENTAVVSAPLGTTDGNGQNWLGDAGEVCIFERQQGGTWILHQKIVPSDREAIDEFGRAIAIHEDLIIVGAPQEDHDENGQNAFDGAGSAYIFERNGNGQWTEVAKLVASDREADDEFGNAVSIDRGVAVVGCRRKKSLVRGSLEDRVGAAYVFESNGLGSWAEVAKIQALDKGPRNDFGGALDVEGDRIAVGATGNSYNSSGADSLTIAGAAYVFQKLSGTWSQIQKIVPPDRALADGFGRAISISGTSCIIGSPAEDGDWNGMGQEPTYGAAYIFERDYGVNISQAFESSPITAYPNPTSANISLDLGASYNQAIISVHDLAGREVGDYQFSHTSQANLPLSEYPAGVYFISCDLDGERHTVKVVRE